MKPRPQKRRTASAAVLLALAVFLHGRAGADEKSSSTTVIGPSNPLLAEGAAALQQGRIEEGIRLTLEGLKLPATPRDVAAGHSNLCAGYVMLKNWDEALAHCNKSLELDATNWRTYNNRAAVYDGKRLYDLALQDIRAGLELAPQSRTLHESLRIVQENKRIHGQRTRAAVQS